MSKRNESPAKTDDGFRVFSVNGKTRKHSHPWPRRKAVDGACWCTSSTGKFNYVYKTKSSMRQFSMNKNEKRSREFREKMINKDEGRWEGERDAKAST